MITIYDQSNYIIIEGLERHKNGVIYTFPKKMSNYVEDIDSFVIRATYNKEVVIIPFEEIVAGNVVNNDMTPVPYTIPSLRTFLQNCTGFNSAGSIPDSVSLNLNGNTLEILDDEGSVIAFQDLSAFLDDTNLARVVSISVDSNGIATFTRDDTSTFTGDFSVLLDNTNLDRIESGSIVGNNIELVRNDGTIIPVDISSLVALESQVTQNASDISDLQVEQLSQQVEIDTNSTNIASLQSDVTTTQGDVSALQTQVGTNTSDIATLQSDLAQEISDRQAVDATIQSQVTDNANDISSLQVQVSDNDTDITDLQNNKANTADLGTTAFSNDYNDLDNLPAPLSNVIGWWNIDDNTFTDVSPQVVLANTRTLLELNSDSAIESFSPGGAPASSIWDDVTYSVTPDTVGASYIVRLNLTANPTLNNRNFTIDLDIGGTQGIILERTTRLARGANNNTKVSLTNSIFALNTFVTNGGRFFITCDGDVELFNISLLIQKVT